MFFRDLPVGVEGTIILALIYVFGYIINIFTTGSYSISSRKEIILKVSIFLWALLLAFWALNFETLHPLDTWSRFIGVFGAIPLYVFAIALPLFMWKEIDIRKRRKNIYQVSYKGNL